jgi:hypothetical protein
MKKKTFAFFQVRTLLVQMQILYAQLEYSTYLASDLKCMHILCAFVCTDGGTLRKRKFQGAILIDGLSWLLEIFIV